MLEPHPSSPFLGMAIHGTAARSRCSLYKHGLAHPGHDLISDQPVNYPNPLGHEPRTQTSYTMSTSLTLPSVANALRTWWQRTLLLLLMLAGGFAFSAMAQSTTIQLGSGSATSSYIPIYYLYDFSHSQAIYTADEMIAAGATGQGNITAIRYLPGASVSTVNWRNWTVYMGNTPKASFSGVGDYVSSTALTQVFNGNIPDNIVANQWMELILDQPFFWDGTSNLVITVTDNTNGWGTLPSWQGYTLAPSSGNKGIYFYQDGSPVSPASPSASSQGATNSVAQIQFELEPPPCSGTPVAGTLPGYRWVRRWCPERGTK